MSTVTIPTEDVKPRPLWRRILRWVVRTIVLLVIAFFVWHYVDLYFANRDLNNAIAEVNKSDPKWRWEDLMAQMPDVPDEKNGALVVRRAFMKLPKNLDVGLPYRLVEIAPVLRLPRPDLRRVEDQHRVLLNAVDEARTLVGFPDCSRFCHFCSTN